MDDETRQAVREVAENARRQAAELANSCHPAETTEVFWADGTKIGELRPVKRWKATIITCDHEVAQHEIEELSELHDIIERGRNFYEIAEIRIVINPAINRKAMVPVEAA